MIGPLPAGKLRWRCRRGARELDTLLNRFLEDHYQSLSPDSQLAFCRLLECQDPDLLDWLMGRRTDYPDAGVGAIIEDLKRINLQ